MQAHKAIRVHFGLILLMGWALLQASTGWAYRDDAYLEEAEYGSLDEVGAGSLLVKGAQGYQPFLRMNADFDVQISGLVSTVTVRQIFQNPGQEWVEAIYVLPLPEDSAVNAMRIKIGERIIEGEIKEKHEAKRIYTQAKAQGKRAGLMQQQRPNLFSTQLANIGPGETVEVELTFLQVLQYDSGQFSLRLPMTITPRFIPGKTGYEQPLQDVQGWAYATTSVPDANRITPPQTYQPQSGSHLATVQVRVNSGFDVEAFNAPYHKVDVTRMSTQYLITTQQGQVPLDRDFVLQWRPVQQQAPVAAYFSEVVEDKHHGLIMLLPPQQADALTFAPRELILVVDSSGSMNGQSMVQAKQALQLALARLRPQDRFNVIDFDSSFQQLFAQPLQASAENIRRAQHFVESLRADGGTQMYAPLQAALGQAALSPADARGDLESLLRQVVFITDGSVGNEAALFELIHQQIGRDRLYTVGIGSAPNAYFMRKAAQFGRGTYTYVGSVDEVQSKMAELFAKIEKPALINVHVDIEGAQADRFPRQIPDLYLGEPLLLKAQFDQAPVSVTVSGQFDGQPWHSQLHLQQGDSSDGIATLWARSKVAFYQDEGVRQGNSALHRNDITQLGIDYGLVTPYTSFVAVDKTPVRPLNADLKSEQVANRMPAGSAQAAPSVGYPKTALGLHWHLLVGVVALVAALAVWQSNEFGGRQDADLA